MNTAVELRPGPLTAAGHGRATIRRSWLARAWAAAWSALVQPAYLQSSDVGNADRDAARAALVGTSDTLDGLPHKRLQPRDLIK
jgi:hypothetical protein